MNSDRPVAVRARYIVPVERPHIRDGVVAILKGQILGAGSADEIARQFDPVAELDLGDCALLPGLINAHTHLEFSDLAEPLGRPGIAFTDWIREVMLHRRAIVGNDSDQVTAIQTGLTESRDAAVAAIGEIATYAQYFTATDLHITQFCELIGISFSRIEEARTKADAHLARNNGDPLFCAGLSPHAPYSCHVDLVEFACRRSSAEGLPVAMHLAETTEEIRFLSESSGPLRDMLEEFGVWDASAFPEPRTPMDYLKLLATADRALIVHGNYLTSEEIQFIGERRKHMNVVYCPRTHAYFGHSEYPLQEMMDANVRIALGTDSRASNPDLSLWDECKHVNQLFPAINPMQLIEMATIEGARALGISQHIGSISPERLARFAVLPVENRQLHSADEIAASLMLTDVDASLQQNVANFLADRQA